MGGYVNDAEYSDDVALGSLDAGTIAMIGDTGDPKCFEHELMPLKKLEDKV